jgi:CheY-like chemotaxis protein
MHQVILNLCTNSEHAMREQGGILEVCLRNVDIDPTFAAQHPELHPGPYVCLIVRDTGHGMSPEIVARIFDPFFTTKKAQEGTGMGLAVVHGIVAGHGGAITVQSAPEVGTTFVIYLSRSEESAVEQLSARMVIPRGTGCILFVDDEPSVARLGQKMLELFGYEVVVCASGAEALEVFQETPHRFDLVITDQTMPHMTGEHLSSALRKIRANIPIILCTGFSYTMDAEKASALGIDAFLFKPLVIRDLGMAVQQVLTRRLASNTC